MTDAAGRSDRAPSRIRPRGTEPLVTLFDGPVTPRRESRAASRRRCPCLRRRPRIPLRATARRSSRTSSRPSTGRSRWTRRCDRRRRGEWLQPDGPVRDGPAASPPTSCWWAPGRCARSSGSARTPAGVFPDAAQAFADLGAARPRASAHDARRDRTGDLDPRSSRPSATGPAPSSIAAPRRGASTPCAPVASRRASASRPRRARRRTRPARHWSTSPAAWGRAWSCPRRGPLLFGQLARAGLLDELFLTVSPQLAGRDPAHDRASPSSRAWPSGPTARAGPASRPSRPPATTSSCATASRSRPHEHHPNVRHRRRRRRRRGSREDPPRGGLRRPPASS